MAGRIIICNAPWVFGLIWKVGKASAFTHCTDERSVRPYSIYYTHTSHITYIAIDSPHSHPHTLVRCFPHMLLLPRTRSADCETHPPPAHPG
jgi:hypothetical protein